MRRGSRRNPGYLIVRSRARPGTFRFVPRRRVPSLAPFPLRPTGRAGERFLACLVRDPVWRRRARLRAERAPPSFVPALLRRGVVAPPAGHVPPRRGVAVPPVGGVPPRRGALVRVAPARRLGALLRVAAARMDDEHRRSLVSEPSHVCQSA